MVGTDPEPPMASSGCTLVAWIAFGVYSLSFLPMGFYFFYIGFLFFLNPLFHTVPNSDYRVVLGGISWLANPILLVGMVALGMGERRTAAVLGIISLGCGLCAAPCIIHPVQFPAYLLWLGSMALVVCGSLLREKRADEMNNRSEHAEVEPDRLERADETNNRSGHAEVEPDRLERADGKPLSKREVERMMELYDELP